MSKRPSYKVVQATPIDRQTPHTQPGKPGQTASRLWLSHLSLQEKTTFNQHVAGAECTLLLYTPLCKYAVMRWPQQPNRPNRQDPINRASETFTLPPSLPPPSAMTQDLNTVQEYSNITPFLHQPKGLSSLTHAILVRGTLHDCLQLNLSAWLGLLKTTLGSVHNRRRTGCAQQAPQSTQ